MLDDLKSDIVSLRDKRYDGKLIILQIKLLIIIRDYSFDNVCRWS